MPEIWLNYGAADVVLDIRDQNLDQSMDPGGTALQDAELAERLSGVDLAGPVDLAVLHDTPTVRRVLSMLLSTCEQKSLPAPRILADARTAALLRPALPQGSEVGEFGDIRPDLVFLAEMELDGLFGYETVATRLLRRFGSENMLSAYAKRRGNTPAPGQASGSMDEARRFADGFEIRCIELVANPGGVVDLAAGHPSETAAVSKSLESVAVREPGEYGTVLISTGKDASNHTLARSLNSLWNCSPAIPRNGLAVLLAESRFGVGSDAVQQFIEGRMGEDRLKNPPAYVGGMEDLLFLTGMRGRFQTGLVSVLPEFYTKKLGMISLNAAKPALEYILKTRGERQKVTIIPDGARTLLRQKS